MKTARAAASQTSVATKPEIPELHDKHADFERVALLLQGGGALGAYQAGAYQALEENGIQPNWIAGISIGAINASIIAGNAPGERVPKLRRFWEMITDPPFEPALQWVRLFAREGDRQHRFVNQLQAGQVLLKGAPQFFEPRFPPPYLMPPGVLGATSFYDTAPLKHTLLELVDFDRLNSGETRFAVGAVNIATGNFAYFDNGQGTPRITPEHIMASGALPPGFPPIEIDGQFYWDGGLVSNTPLEWILHDKDLDTLAFQIDLWNARGDIPKDLAEVEVRQKEIQYSSRTRAATDRARDYQRLRGALKRILSRLPEDFGQEEDIDLLNRALNRKTCNVVQLIYRAQKYEGASKDYEFSRLMMEEHWAAGYRDARHSLDHPEIFRKPRNAEGFVSYDFGAE
ncbi:patatin-like phospholipase family protein [Labrys miyagiensis]|uniref:patatin-like phospholipase family protein n=1 Tax=Labrys miyagiensis TaxID=346912 RepID=UPI0032AF9E88